MADDATFSHLFQPLANQRVLVGVQFDGVGNRLVDEITARPVLRGSKGIKTETIFYVLQDIVVRRSSGVSDGAHTHTFARNATV